MDERAYIKAAVCGDIEKIENDTICIHPMLGNRWRIANALIKDKDVEVYVNENGMEVSAPNMACLRFQRDSGNLGIMSVSEYMSQPLVIQRIPYYGRIALVMSHETLSNHIDPDCLTLKDDQTMRQLYLKRTGLEEEKDEAAVENEKNQEIEKLREEIKKNKVLIERLLKKEKEEEETKEETACRVMKEDEVIKKTRLEGHEKTGLEERFQKRKVSYLNHKDFIDNMFVEGTNPKGIRYRRLLQSHLRSYSEEAFDSEEEEYKHIGKYGRVGTLFSEKVITTFNKAEQKIVNEIAKEYGAFDY